MIVRTLMRKDYIFTDYAGRCPVTDYDLLNAFDFGVPAIATTGCRWYRLTPEYGMKLWPNKEVADRNAYSQNLYVVKGFAPKIIDCIQIDNWYGFICEAAYTFAEHLIDQHPDCINYAIRCCDDYLKGEWREGYNRLKAVPLNDLVPHNWGRIVIDPSKFVCIDFSNQLC